MISKVFYYRETIYIKTYIMKYLHKFESESAFTEHYNSEDYIEPWVSYTKDEETEQVDYNKPDPANGHCYVDLGLPSGTKWGCTNIGAVNPEDVGNKYYWGETEPYDDDRPYKFGSFPYTKYGPNDEKAILDLEDDVANVEWGGGWHIPTIEQVYELMDNCTREIFGSKSQYEDGGSWYVVFTSNINGNSVTFPLYFTGEVSWINECGDNYRYGWAFVYGCEGYFGPRLAGDSGAKGSSRQAVRGVLGAGPEPGTHVDEEEDDN